MFLKDPFRQVAITVPPTWKLNKNKFDSISVVCKTDSCGSRLKWVQQSKKSKIKRKFVFPVRLQAGSVLAGVLPMSIWHCSQMSCYSPVPAMSSSSLLSSWLLAVTGQYGFFIFILWQAVQCLLPLFVKDFNVKLLNPTCVTLFSTCPSLLLCSTFPIEVFSGEF